jgi:UDP-hydrolysing UDP-N-acetyl-D-glucosamine 2-epimerase
MGIKNVCVVLVDRANYGRMHPVMRAIANDSDLNLITICAGTMLLERFGSAFKVVEADGFKIDGIVYLEVEGSTQLTMAKGIGLGIIEFASEFNRIKPDLVLLIGDRYEAFAAAIASSYMNIPVAHIQGGEVSGSIDESARHAISKLSHLHFPSTKRSMEYLLRMGECIDNVHNVGCPAGDYILNLDYKLPANYFELHGVGCKIDLEEQYILVMFHPVTTTSDKKHNEVNELIAALECLRYPTIWIWPNIDAGSDEISKAIRVYRENHKPKWLHLIKNLEPIAFQTVLKTASCAIGNSSSFIRDSTFSGTPVVLLGNRQDGRECGENLISCNANKEDIIRAVKSQLKKGRYPISKLYGSGDASNKIVNIIKKFKPYSQKKLSYVNDCVDN